MNTYRYPLVANPETKRLEEIKEDEFLTLSRSGIVSAISIEAATFFGNLVGIASTSLSLFDASKIEIGIISPDRLSGLYNIGVTTSTNLEDAANILSGTISPGRLSGLYGIDISGVAENATNLLSAANITAGIIARPRLSGTYDVNITGAAFTATYADAANTATFANFAVGTAVEVLGSSENKEFYPTFATGIGFTQVRVNTNTLSFNPFSGNLGIGTNVPRTSLQVNSYGVETGGETVSASSTTFFNIDSFNLSQTNFKTAEYTVHISYGSSIQAQKVLVMQDGTNAYSEEYAIMSQSSPIVTIGSTISSGNCILRARPKDGVSGIVTYRFVRNTLL